MDALSVPVASIVYFVSTPDIIKPLYPSLVWDMLAKNKVVYLTFDDGPTTGVTDKVFALLEEFQAKATFFLIGKNVETHPEYLNRYKEYGHTIGNHSFHHRNGWNATTENYIADVEKASKLIDSKLFRPPYGKITRAQIKKLKSEFTIVMWDVLSGDFDPKVNSESCYKNVVDNVVPGSIIVFHDSVKASNPMLEALPKILSELDSRGFRFEALPQQINSPLNS